jgi:hypothetical protein
LALALVLAFVFAFVLAFEPFALSSASAASFAASFAAFAASRSARLRFISSIEGQSSLKQSFQGRPGLNFWATETRGVRPQTVQMSSSLWTS